jgi:D-sedoheptulose 7-phosphate isomerase
MDIESRVERAFRGSLALKEAVLERHRRTIVAMAEMWVACLRRGGKILLCGNGGSAADAQHLAAELVNRFLQERPALAAVALTTDSSILTATANDRAFQEVFARQVEALGQRGDILFLLSTSGRSANLFRAADVARAREMTVMALLGGDGGGLEQLCHFFLVVPSAVSPRVQEVHILIGHLLCEVAEAVLFPPSSQPSG